MRGQMTHLDPDVLAEFRAGLMTGRRRARVAAHLAGCDRCSALSDQLAEVTALLAAVPAPAMPDGMAQRLEAVLATETASKDYSERASGASPSDRGAHHRAARHRGWRLAVVRVLAPAAAIIVLAAGGYGLSRIIGGGPANSAPAPGSAAGPAAPSSGPANGPALEIRASSGLKVVTSSTDYQHATLGQQLEQAMRARGASRSEPASARLRACVQQVTGGAGPVLLENALYQGQPATVIVASSRDGYTAWVMAPGCSATLDKVTLPGTSAP